ncbi:MAG: DM13 domain-containing protein [Myxococcota bacterium]
MFFVSTLGPAAARVLVCFVLGVTVACSGTDLIAETPTLRVTPDRLALARQGEARLNAELYVRVQTDALVVGNTRALWRSEDPSIATVDTDGRVVGVSEGQVLIFATPADDTAVVDPSDLESLVTVVASTDSVASVEIVDDDLLAGESNLVLGASVEFDAVLTTVEGVAIDGREITWNSSDPSVASVDEFGRVEAIGIGVTQIVARSEGVRSLPRTVRVIDLENSTRGGRFSGRSNYRVEGRATLRFDADGGLELRLEPDFGTQSGPDLDVILSNSERFTGSSVNLGDLRQFSGLQTYAVPNGVSIDEFDYVLIYCVAFGANFGVAELGSLQ